MDSFFVIVVSLLVAFFLVKGMEFCWTYYQTKQKKRRKPKPVVAEPQPQCSNHANNNFQCQGAGTIRDLQDPKPVIKKPKPVKQKPKPVIKKPKPKPKPRKPKYQELQPAIDEVPRAKYTRLPHQETSVIPLKYKLGEFMISFKFGDETDVDAALDSGSSTIIVSGSTCEYCPPGEKYPLDEINPNKVTLMRYSSQTNHVVWREDDVTLSDGTEIPRLLVGVTHKIVKNRGDMILFNVFGLSPVHRPVGPAPGFWKQQDHYDDKWALVANKRAPKLYLGKWPSDLTQRGTVITMTSMLDLTFTLPSAAQLPTRFPIVRGNVFVDGALLVEDAFLLLDTGYTENAMHPDLLRQIPGAHTLQVAIKSGLGGPVVYQCPGTRFKEPPEPLNLHPKLIVLGNLWMMNKTFGVDWDENTTALL